MAVSAARAAAFEILLRVEREDSYASELLHSGRMAKLSPRDHGLATEIVMGVLRWRSVLDLRISAASSQSLNRLDGEVLTALRLGAYQLQFLSRVPAHAAIFESVEVVKAARKRSAASFVNAVLRKIARAPAPDVFAEIGKSAAVSVLAASAAHPSWLVARWAEQYGFETARLICSYDQTIPETAIHIYGDHSQSDLINGNIDADADAELAASGVQVLPGRLLTSARRVVAGDATKTLAFSKGRFSIQDEASQLVALLAGLEKSTGRHGDDRAVNDPGIDTRLILDCCAAPGNKTALLAQRNPRAQVFAIELHPHRARLLKNLSRAANVHVIAADARQLPFSCAFDRILVDVPCSGTGTLARNPEIKWRLKFEDLKDLQARQISILKSALSRLAVGGRLVYSTCSLEREENESVVEAVVDGRKFRVADFASELDELRETGELRWEDFRWLLSGPYLRTIPGIHPCDGFFAAMVERI
jgi:16S rRNA (cytosine967-C5)-methyltransferase